MPCRVTPIKPGKLLVVAPHFDDDVIPCGGTLLLHKRIGSDIGVVFLSDSGGPSPDEGHRRKITAMRKREAESSAAAIGYEILAMLDHRDGFLGATEKVISARLIEIVAQWEPNQILCPFPTDAHEDHQAAAAAVARALSQLKFDGTIWAYELWSTLWPNVLVDITSVADEKHQAICRYASQQNERDYASAILGLNCYRGLPFKIPYCEAFFVCGSAQFSTIVRSMRR